MHYVKTTKFKTDLTLREKGFIGAVKMLFLEANPGPLLVYAAKNDIYRNR